jgi:HYR domain
VQSGAHSSWLRDRRLPASGLAWLAVFSLLLVPSAGAADSETVITSAPPLLSTSSTAVFEFTHPDTTSFTCSLDAGGGTACTSPHVYSGLDNGVHAFAVKGVGTNGPPARYSWTVAVASAAGPTTTIVSGPAGETTVATATFEFTASEDGATFACSLDTGGFEPCTSPRVYDDLDPGEHVFRVRATGAGGITGPPASRTWTVSPPADDPPVLSLPPAQTREADGPAGARATYVVTATDGDGNPLPDSAISCSPASGSTFPLGTTTVACTAEDGAGNETDGSFAITVRDTTPPAINAPDVSVTATRVSGIRRSDPALARYLAGVSATDLVSQPTLTYDVPDALPVGRTEIAFTARDAAGNAATKRSTVTVLPLGIPAPAPDLTPPADVRRAAAVAGDRVVRLRWTVPTRDFSHVTVTRTIVGRAATARVVYRGRGLTYVDRRLRNDVVYRYVIVAFDRVGNRSRGVVVTARPKAVLLARPRPGQRVFSPPLLRWVPVPAASYFNVQLWRGRTKLLSAWPNLARYQLTRTWTYDGRLWRLQPGLYTWYVWPGLGPRSRATYGEMLGVSTFVVVASPA